MDPLDHELKLLRHITRCTNMNDQKTSQLDNPKKKQETSSRPMTPKWKQRFPKIPTLSTQDNSAPSLISQEDEICQERNNKVGEDISNSNTSSGVLLDATNADVKCRSSSRRSDSSDSSVVTIVVVIVTSTSSDSSIK